MQETPEVRVQSLGPEDLLEEERATHASILAWRVPWTEGCTEQEHTFPRQGPELHDDSSVDSRTTVQEDQGA